MPTISGTHVEHAVRLADLWCLGVVLVGLYRWSGSIWPAAVFHFSLGFWDSVTIGEPGVPGMIEGTLGGLPTLTVLRAGVDAALALALLARWRSAHPVRRTVAVIEARPRAGAPAAGTLAAAATSPTEPARVRGASAGVMLLLIGWSVMLVVAFLTLLHVGDVFDQELVYNAPMLAETIQADVLVHAGWMIGGIIGVYLLARTDRAAPSFWIVYLALSAGAFGFLLRAGGAEMQTEQQAAHRMMQVAVSLAVAFYMMFSRGVRQTFGTNGFSLGPLEDLRRRLQGR
jgi:hypothetical protein